MKAVYSYWEDNRKKVNGGFACDEDLAITLTLSVELAKKQFEEVELVTNTYGKKLLIDKYNIPFDNVLVVLDQFDNKLDADLWAFIKIYAYSIQTKPFIHIDNDVLIWDRIPDDVLESPLFFQNKEMLREHTSYIGSINSARRFPKVNLDILNTNPEFAYNCGVVGVNDLSIMIEWKALAEEYLFSPENATLWSTIKDKHSNNHLFEQYFISCLIKSKAIPTKTLLKDDFLISAVRDFKYTHLWGETKRKPEMMRKIRRRLFTDFPKTIANFLPNSQHKDIFENIYKNELWGAGEGSGAGSSPTLTTKYREFLQQFLVEKNVTTVADYGCGDWQFSKLIDWTNFEYKGYDCALTVINTNKQQFKDSNLEFIFTEKVSEVQPADLLIVKDVLIHWSNKEVLDFYNYVKATKKFKYILITNQTLVNEFLNEDISTGEFRNIDINKEPFCFDAEVVFEWDNDNKTTYLLTFNK